MISTNYKILAIAPTHFVDFVSAESAMAAKIQASDLQALGQADDEQEQSRLLQIVDNTAVISIKGRLVNSVSFFNRYFGMVAYDEIREAIMQGVDEGVSSILFDIDSPGGSVDGMADLANLISNLPVATLAFTSSSMMSAAYFLGCQCDVVYADSFSDVGSVGVIIKFYDRSKMLADMGVKPMRFRSGDLKAAGDGDFKLSAKETKYIASKVQNFADKFYDIVSDARGLPLAALESLDITSGRTFIGQEAVDVGLVDAIKSFDESMLKAFDLAKKVDKKDMYSLP